MALPPDALLPQISQTSELAQRVLAALQTDGYIVLEDVLSASECAAEVERLWDFVTSVSPAVQRDEPMVHLPLCVAHGQAEVARGHVEQQSALQQQNGAMLRCTNIEQKLE